jgi:uncharacterized protein YuzE
MIVRFDPDADALYVMLDDAPVEHTDVDGGASLH